MKSPVYRCTYQRDDNATLLVSCGAFPEVVTYGDDLEQASGHALGAIEEAIAARMSDGRPVPVSSSHEDSVGQDTFVVMLPQQTAQKVLLYALLREAGMTRAELARRLGWHREQVDRLFRLDHASRAGQLDAAFAALGREVEVAVIEKLS
jgi:antitoxin HicB